MYVHVLPGKTHSTQAGVHNALEPPIAQKAECTRECKCCLLHQHVAAECIKVP